MIIYKNHLFYRKIRLNDVLERKSLRKFIINTKNTDFFHEKASSYIQLTRLSRPIGSILVFFPAAWSIVMASPPGVFPDLYLLCKFACGAFLTRSAGCVINDALDCKFDSMVSRTKFRPMAQNLVSLKEAAILSVSLLLAAFCILCTLDSTSIKIGVFSVLMIISYPLFKRFTYYPQVMLGFTFNVGCLMGWSSVSNDFNFRVAVPLYLGSVFWTIFYDTIYGFQDVADDMRIGLKSLSIRILQTKHAKLCLSLIAMSSVLLWGISGCFSDQTATFYCSLGFVCLHYIYQICCLKVDDPIKCMKIFKSNQILAFGLFIGICISQLCKIPSAGEINAI